LAVGSFDELAGLEAGPGPDGRGPISRLYGGPAQRPRLLTGKQVRLRPMMLK